MKPEIYDGRLYTQPEVERMMLEARIGELDKLIDIEDKTFNRWSQRDIANFFNVVGKRYRELEAECNHLSQQPIAKFDSSILQKVIKRW